MNHKIDLFGIDWRDEFINVLSGTAIIPAENYDVTHHVGSGAIPLKWGHVPAYVAINASLWRMEDTAYLIVTHSLAQESSPEVDFEIDLGPGVTSVTPVLGPGSPSVRDGRIVLDAFTGIDGRVYRVEYR